jgi:hypothetical protein
MWLRQLKSDYRRADDDPFRTAVNTQTKADSPKIPDNIWNNPNS